MRKFMRPVLFTNRILAPRGVFAGSLPPTHMHMYMLIENPKWFDLSLLCKPGLQRVPWFGSLT